MNSLSSYLSDAHYVLVLGWAREKVLIDRTWFLPSWGSQPVAGKASGGSGLKNEQEGGRAEGQEEGSKHRDQHVQRPWGD